MADVWAADKKLAILYGLTELTINCYANICLGGDSEFLGQPFPGLTSLVVNEGGKGVPDGAPGELLLGGPFLSTAYLNRPKLSSERWVEGSCGRVFRTGDRVRRLLDGRLEFLGRMDDQVKIRGFRVELGEVEAGLRRLDGVEEAVVTVMRLNVGKESETVHLVAYYVGEREVGEEEWRSFLGPILQLHLIPSAFIRLDQLPKSVTGKVDRRALPSPLHLPPPTVKAQPQDWVEEVLHEIWSTCLGIPKTDFGVTDSFFALGGDSIIVLRMVSRIRNSFPTRLSMREFMGLRTIREQASSLLASTIGDRVPSRT